MEEIIIYIILMLIPIIKNSFKINTFYIKQINKLKY